MSLAGVLDHDQAVSPGDRDDRVHVGRLPVEVNRHDRLGARPDRVLDESGIDIEGCRIGIDEHRRSAGGADRQCGGDEGIGRGDHLVTGPDLERTERQLERGEAGVHADGGRGSAVLGELLLEGRDVPAQDPVVTGEAAGNRLVHVVLDRRRLGGEVNEGKP